MFPSDWTHETTLHPVHGSPSLARQFVTMHLLANHLPHLVEDVRLVASELATNAVTHARTPFVLTLSRTTGSAMLAVRDGATERPAPFAAGNTDVNGRGLMIVASLSESWGSSTDAHGFKSVWASFPVAYQEVGLNPVR